MVLSQIRHVSFPDSPDIDEARETSAPSRLETEASIRLAPPVPSSWPFPAGAAALRGGGGGSASSRGFSMALAPPSAPPAASTITGDGSESLEMFVTSGEPSVPCSRVPSSFPSTDSHDAPPDIVWPFFPRGLTALKRRKP
eukprot:1595365-Rhodomonas_salina.1